MDQDGIPSSTLIVEGWNQLISSICLAISYFATRVYFIMYHLICYILQLVPATVVDHLSFPLPLPLYFSRFPIYSLSFSFSLAFLRTFFLPGANIFTTPEARENLFKHGVTIVKDSSANKVHLRTGTYHSSDFDQLFFLKFDRTSLQT